MRRLAARRGFEVERALLVGDEEAGLSLACLRCKASAREARELDAWGRLFQARGSLARCISVGSKP